jgi:hypothetical protein
VSTAPATAVSIHACCAKVKPTYTAEAMRAKVQGSVFLECVILPDGSVGRVEVVKSLDPDLRTRSGSHQGCPAVALCAGDALSASPSRCS